MKDPDFLVPERIEFEKWALGMGWRTARTAPYGVYTDRRTNAGWLAWVARMQRIPRGES